MNTKFGLLVGIGCFAALTALPSAASSQDWLQGYADAANSGYSSSAMTATPRLVWGIAMKDADGTRLHPNSGSAIHNGVLFTSADKNPLKKPGSGWSEFFAIDTRTGRRLWTFDPHLLGAVHDGLVAVDVARSQVIYPAHDGNIRALDMSTGALLWTLQVCDTAAQMCDLEGGVTLANGRAYYVSNDWLHAIALDRVHPFEIWRYPRGEIAHGVATKPVVSGGKVYFGGFGRFWALDELSGRRIWQSSTSLPKFTYGFDIPHVSGGTVYASASRSGSNQTMVTAFDAATGTVRWERVLRLGFAVKSSAAYGKWFLSFSNGSTDGGVIALDLNTGRTVWTFDHVGSALVAPINGGPAAVDNKVIFGASDGTVYMLDQATGLPLWSFATGESMHSPVAVSDGKFFLGAYKTFRAFGP
jgi:outer membrane protein assembly factor BamB